MKLDATAEFTLGLIAKLYAGQELSTVELREVLQRANIHSVVIDYIADLHARKVESKTSTPATIAKRSMQKIDAFIAVSNEVARARRTGKKISESKAIELAARRAGVSPPTMRRHLKQPSRKR